MVEEKIVHIQASNSNNSFPTSLTNFFVRLKFFGKQTRM